MADKSIVVVNPNTTAGMTDQARAAAERVAAPGFAITAVNPEKGPASIEGHYDGAVAVPGVLDAIRGNPGADGYVIACFDDTGLDAARCLTDAPVVGVGEASYHLATMVAPTFGVVTTLSRSVDVLEQNLLRYGLMERCTGVRASDVPVLELEKGGGFAKIDAEAGKAVGEDGAEAIVLGCAGMGDIADRIREKHGVPVISPVESAVKLVEAMVSLGLRTSKVNSYRPPRDKG